MKENFQVKDYSVSKEEFTLRYDEQYHMFHTTPKPTLKGLDKYYESENYISHTDGNSSLLEKVYQFVKRITLSRKQKLLKNYNPEKGSLLDLGAGTGDFLEYCKRKGWVVQGVEPSEKARSLAQSKGLPLKSDRSELSDTYDVITMWHVLEHVYDLNEQLDWLKKSLKDSGTLFIAVPNFDSYDASFYKNHWAAYDVPRHLYHFSRKSISLLLEERGLDVIDVKGMKFDAFYVSLLSEKYSSGKMRFLNAFITGMRSNVKASSSGAYSSLIYVVKHSKI